MSARIFFSTLSLLLVVSGCSLFGSDETVAHGVVVSKDTQQPIAGILVSLVDGGGAFGAYTAVAETHTDRDGRFRVASSVDGGGSLQLFVNQPTYDQRQRESAKPGYIQYFESITQGKTKRFRIEI